MLLLKSQKLEHICIGVVQFYHMLAFDAIMSDPKNSTNTLLKNLMFQVHQNFLVVILVILSRIPKTKINKNKWANLLEKAVEQKKMAKLRVRNKVEAIQQLKTNIENSKNILTNLCRSNRRKVIFKTIDMWINGAEMPPLDHIRENMYNIEQYRADAVILPALDKNKITDTGAGKLAGDAIKPKKSDSSSSGAAASNSALTGKNPFAILKASAIASSSKTIFPNNFANLPKVFPPFLDPLPADQQDRYTLVLDLDETLIHNIEVRIIMQSSNRKATS